MKSQELEDLKDSASIISNALDFFTNQKATAQERLEFLKMMQRNADMMLGILKRYTSDPDNKEATKFIEMSQ